MYRFVLYWNLSHAQPFTQTTLKTFSTTMFPSILLLFTITWTVKNVFCPSLKDQTGITFVEKVKCKIVQDDVITTYCTPHINSLPNGSILLKVWIYNRNIIHFLMSWPKWCIWKKTLCHEIFLLTNALLSFKKEKSVKHFPIEFFLGSCALAALVLLVETKYQIYTQFIWSLPSC